MTHAATDAEREHDRLREEDAKRRREERDAEFHAALTDARKELVKLVRNLKQDLAKDGMRDEAIAILAVGLLMGLRRY